MGSISVVIPTKDRPEALIGTLESLAGQETAAGQRFEVLVVDNGSAERTRATVRGVAAGSQIPIELIEHPEGGPAAARNAALAAAQGDVVLMLGDDTEAADRRLLAGHLELHASRPEPEYAVLGRITWTPKRPVTPFMRWLEDGGPQFNYLDLEPGPVDAASYLYSSHVSVKRAILERVGGFDPRFPTAAVEDTELGVRLADAGLLLEYHPELLVLHDHPTTPPQAFRRSIAVGRSAALYNRLRPDRPHPAVRPPDGAAWVAVRLASPLLRPLSQAPLPRPVRETVWLAMTRAGYERGYRLADDGAGT
jgi:glycosyltransferase involved in cell wall biosynthesis